MEEFYRWCAILAGTMLFGQFLLSLLGIGGDHDGGLDHEGGLETGGLDHDGFDDIEIDHEGLDDSSHVGDTQDGHHDGIRFASLLSFRALVASMAIFGLTGIAASREYDPALAFSMATAAGIAVLFLVGWLMNTFYGLATDGTIHIEQTMGMTGRVYVKVPADSQGQGRVTVLVGDRTVEFQAVTAQDQELPTGTPVIVTNVLNDKLIEVSRRGA
ncbi:hypothetical protein [Thalassoroseus pseudoceratinae]|uniref:hypothetical protein n=1 Tax=Thalassoroseus pseudoceratinae TaxID=2713176 RepID=UPI00141E4B5A|nr:hypothetical protein [Thalassoroseus pseudoceratinae]